MIQRHALVSFVLGGVVSITLLWYAFRGVDLGEVVRGFGRIGANWLMASVVAGLVSLVVRAVRWRILLQGIKPMSIGPLVAATFIGMMANNILPARIGEVARAWVLARQERVATSSVLASIVAERLMDVVAALVFLGAALVVSHDLDGPAADLLTRTGLVVLVTVLAGTAALGYAVVWRADVLVWAERLAAWLDRPWLSSGVEVLSRFLQGLWALKGGGWTTAFAGCLSLLVWGMSIGSFHLLAHGLDMQITLVQTTLVFVIVLFGVAIPSAPGFVGTFHGFCVAGLTMVAGTDPTVAATYATLVHGTQWLAVNVIGAGFLIAEPAGTWAKMASSAGQSSSLTVR